MNINSQLLKKISRLTLVGLSAGILLAVSIQPLNLSTFERGPQQILAEDGDSDSGSQSLQISCSGGPNPAGVDQSVTWNANVSGGVAPYNISWVGAASGSGASVTNSYSNPGTKTSSADVTDAAGTFLRSNNCTVEIYGSAPVNTPVDPGQGSIPPQAPANSQCILGPAGVANYPGPTGSSQWCSCAAQNSDMGSLMRENCPQAPRDVANPTQPARSCDDLAADYGVCGQRTYDRCNLRYMGTQAYYDCQASQNAQCQGTIRCASQDRQTTVTNPTQGGGATAVANCPTGTTPTTGSSQNTVVCVANANSNNNTNNNTNTSNSTSQSSATGGSAVAYGGAGGSSIVTINGVAYPANNGQRIVYATNGNVGVGTSNGQRIVYVQSASGVKELPKTGLPLLAWSALAFLPAGIKMRRFSSIKEDFASNATYLWEQRSFKRS